MKTILTAVLTFVSVHAFSQSVDIQREINQQVWKPFIQSYNDRNDEAFAAVHSREVVRIIQDDSVIWGYNRYFRPKSEEQKKRSEKWKRQIDLRFVQRVASDQYGFEIGYYKVVNTNTESGKIHMGYGKFHVLLRKEDGVWKILMDADAQEDASEETFQAAQPMDQS